MEKMTSRSEICKYLMGKYDFSLACVTTQIKLTKGYEEQENLRKTGQLHKMAKTYVDALVRI